MYTLENSRQKPCKMTIIGGYIRCLPAFRLTPVDITSISASKANIILSQVFISLHAHNMVNVFSPADKTVVLNLKHPGGN